VPRRSVQPPLRLAAAVLSASLGVLLVLSVQVSLADGRRAPHPSSHCMDDHGVVEPGNAHAPECASHQPTVSPTASTTGTQTTAPTGAPTPAPTASLTPAPTGAPTPAPTTIPSSLTVPTPTLALTGAPTRIPVPRPTAANTPIPPGAPTQSADPSPTVLPAQVVAGATSGPGNDSAGGMGTTGDSGSEVGIGILSGGPLGEVAAGLFDGGPGTSQQGNLGLAGALATAVLLLSLFGAVVAGSSGGVSGIFGAVPGGLTGGGGAAGAARAASLASGGRSAATGGATVGGAAVAEGSGQVGDAMVHGSSAAGGITGGASTTGSATVEGSGTVLAGATGHGMAGALTGAGAVISGGFALPLPRPDLVQGGLSIFRSMKRVTEDADPSGFSAGDMAQFLGDAAGLAALASFLAPTVGVLSLATSGAAAASDVKRPQEVIDALRENFGRLGYMQGIVDANVSRSDGDLGRFGRTASSPLPDAPADPKAMKDAALATAGAEWSRLTHSARGDIASDKALIGYLDARRADLSAQASILTELLDRSESGVEVGVDATALAALTFGLGWYTGGDSARMATDLRDSFEGPGSGRAGNAAAASPKSEAGTDGQFATTLDDWAAEVGAKDSCLGTLAALAGVERWRGFCDAVANTVGDRLAAARALVDQTEAVHRELSTEIERRDRQERGA
jgi:hypothetical protein